MCKCVNGNAKLLEDLTGADNSTQTGLDIEISRTGRSNFPAAADQVFIRISILQW